MKNFSIQELRNRPWVADYQPPAPPDENSNVRFSHLVADSKNPIIHNRCYPMHVIMVIRWRRPRRRSRERSKLRKQNCRNSCRKVSASLFSPDFFLSLSLHSTDWDAKRCPCTTHHHFETQVHLKLPSTALWFEPPTIVRWALSKLWVPIWLAAASGLGNHTKLWES